MYDLSVPLRGLSWQSLPFPRGVTNNNSPDFLSSSCLSRILKISGVKMYLLMLARSEGASSAEGFSTNFFKYLVPLLPSLSSATPYLLINSFGCLTKDAKALAPDNSRVFSICSASEVSSV